MLVKSYLLRQFAYAMIYQTLALVGIVYLIQSLRFFKWIALRQINISEFFQLSVLMIPQFLTYLIPFSCVLSTLYVFQQLKTQRELIALSVLGVPDHQILRPIFFLILSIVLLQLGLHLLLPHSAQRFQSQEKAFLSRLDLQMVKPKQFNTMNNAVIYIDQIQGECARQVFLYYELPQHKQIFITATLGQMKSCGNRKMIQLTNGYQVQWDACNKTKQTLSFQNLNYDLGVLKSRKFLPSEIVLTKKWRSIVGAKDVLSQAEAYVRAVKIILPLLGFLMIALFFKARQFSWLALGCCGLNLAMIGLANVLPLILKILR